MYKPTRRQVDVKIKFTVDVPLSLKNNISTYISEHLEEIMNKVINEDDYGKIHRQNDEEGIRINGTWYIGEEDYED